MTSNGALLVVRMMGTLLPKALGDCDDARRLLADIAAQAVTACVAVPPRTVVCEQFRLFPHLLKDAIQLGTTYEDLHERGLTGEVIDRVVVREDVRFLKLGKSDLEEMAATGRIRCHWFKEGAIAMSGGEARDAHPAVTMRCLRQASFADDARPRNHIHWPAIRYESGYEFEFGPSDVFVAVASEDQLVPLSRMPTDDSDPHRLRSAAPAVYQIYVAARTYGERLGLVYRGRAPKDVERLHTLRRCVEQVLAKAGGPFGRLSARAAAFRVVDPCHVWDRGSTPISFCDGIRAVANYQDRFGTERFMTDPLAIIIDLVDEVGRERNRRRPKDAQSVHWPNPHSDVSQWLETRGFRGAAFISELAGIILWQPKDAPMKKKRTISKPRPTSDVRGRRRPS